ncbi:MAG: hypothetical protein ACP5P3_04460 [Ignavibacteria bacterium]
MIDFVLKIGKEIKSSNYYELDFLSSFYKRKVENTYERISVCFYYKDETNNDFLETEEHLFFLIGYIFPRFDFRNMVKNKSLLDYYHLILEDYRRFLYTYKGNYTIILLNKKNKTVSLFNSILSTNFIFYFASAENVVVSSSLWLMLGSLKSFKIDPQALIEICIFDYILGNKTLIKDVYHLEYGDIAHLSNSQVKKENLYDFRKLIKSAPLTSKESTLNKANLIEVMKYNIKQIIDTERKFLFPITGGLDSRLNLSLVDNSDRKKIVTYTYGMEKSVQFRIAQKVVSTLELEHIPVYLNNEFSNLYPFYGENAILLSSGYAPYMRANFYYAFSKLQRIASSYVSGVFGSELIKPMHLSGGQSLNYSTVRLFREDDHWQILNEIFDRGREKGFIKAPLWTLEIKDKIYTYLESEYFKKYSGLNWKEKLFLFHLKEGMRKFFMEELSIERYLVRVYTPYLDLDFIEFLFSSSYAGLYNGIFEESLFKRRKGQYFYADVLGVTAPQLAEIPTDRGIVPKDLKSFFGWLKVVRGYFFTKMLKTKIIGNDTYNQNLWDNIFLNHFKDSLQVKDDFFNISFNYLDKVLRSGHSYEFSRHLSLKLWLNKVYQLF